MPDVYRIGPCHLFYGNPTTALGAGMLYLGATKGDVKFSPNILLAMGYTDQNGRSPRADSVFRVGATPMVSGPLLDETKVNLAKLLPGSSVVTSGGKTALSMGSGFSKLTTPDTLVLLPVDQVALGTNGIEATDAIWLPSAVCRQFGDLTFGIPAEGDDTIFTPRETQFAGLYREKDQAAVALPASARLAFIGPPAAHGLGWSLPAAA